MYIPKKVDTNLYTFFVRTKICPVCKKQMVRSQLGVVTFGNDPLSFHSQCAAAGIVLESHAEDEHGNAICKECVDNGRAKFICSLCRRTFPTDMIQKSVGSYLRSHLCKECFNTVSAKEWEDKVQELEENHKWDNY